LTWDGFFGISEHDVKATKTAQKAAGIT